MYGFTGHNDPRKIGRYYDLVSKDGSGTIIAIGQFKIFETNNDSKMGFIITDCRNNPELIGTKFFGNQFEILSRCVWLMYSNKE